MSAPYRLVKKPVLVHIPRNREVFFWESGLLLTCPCSVKRLISIKSPPFGMSFSNEGVLTVDGSISGSGYIGFKERPKHWCHFFLKDGQPQMCDDTKCPGGREIE